MDDRHNDDEREEIGSNGKVISFYHKVRGRRVNVDAISIWMGLVIDDKNEEKGTYHSDSVLAEGRFGESHAGMVDVSNRTVHV